jgi:hypothetical protein
VSFAALCSLKIEDAPTPTSLCPLVRVHPGTKEFYENSPVLVTRIAEINVTRIATVKVTRIAAINVTRIACYENCPILVESHTFHPKNQ